MKWIALTGGIATGKSTVADLLKKMGHTVLDADVVAREVVAPGTKGLAQIIQIFGPEFLRNDQSLDRKKLGQRVFADPKSLQQLERIVHPLIQAEVKARREKLARSGLRLAFYDIPLLFEKNLEQNFDLVVVVAATRGQQLSRLMQRDKLTRAEAEHRLQNQLPIEAKVQRGDIIIENSGGLDELKSSVDRAQQLILQQL